MLKRAKVPDEGGARIARVSEQKAFQNLAKSRKRGAAGAAEEAEGRTRQQAILTLLKLLPDTLHKDRYIEAR